MSSNKIIQFRPTKKTRDIMAEAAHSSLYGKEPLFRDRRTDTRKLAILTTQRVAVLLVCIYTPALALVLLVLWLLSRM